MEKKSHGCLFDFSARVFIIFSKNGAGAAIPLINKDRDE